MFCITLGTEKVLLSQQTTFLFLRGTGVLPCEQEEWLTFIISTTVLRAIKVMMAYSNGGDTTNFHILYWKHSLFSGMYLVNGLALMAKSMQALCLTQRNKKKSAWKSNKKHERQLACSKRIMLGFQNIERAPVNTLQAGTAQLYQSRSDQEMKRTEKINCFVC